METVTQLKPHIFPPFTLLKSTTSPWANNVIFSRFLNTQRLKFCRLNQPNPAINQQTLRRNLVVKSEIAAASSPENASYSITELQLGSRVRAICFYAVTAIASIPLFVMMVLVHPFVLLFDRYRRRAHHLIAKECLKRCMDLVKKGASVFFFPEGTRSKDGKLGQFKKGAFTVAVKTDVPVVPITLMGTGNLMPAGMEGVLNAGSVKVIIHKPILGSNADVLCSEARSVIADTLVLHGYGVHYSE